MSRVSHIPVCRLHHVTPRTATAEWRRASAGVYGEITHDDRGRQQVELAKVEAVEGRVFEPEDIARALGTPKKDPHHQRRRAERLQQFMPGPIVIDTGPVNFFCANEARAFALGCVQRRDEAWRRYLANIRKPYGR